MGGVELEWQTEVKYLGLWLDQGLTWSLHMTKKMAACKKTIMQLRGSVGKLWGPSPYLMRWAYLCIVRPSFLYGHLIWGHACISRFRTQMAALQRLALTLSGSFRKGTPAEGLNIIMHVPPLDIHLQGEIIRSYYRLEHKLVGPFYQPVRRGHLVAASELFHGCRLPPVEADVMPPVGNDRKSFLVIASSLVTGQEVATNKLTVFTDGSKDRDGNTGLGVTITTGHYTSLDYSTYLGKETSVFQAETLAVARACEEISAFWSTELDPDRRVIIYCDNQAVLRAVNSKFVRSKTVLRCVRALNALGADSLVSLRWIRAHDGTPGNELADRLARRGAALGGVAQVVPYPHSYIRRHIDAYITDMWNQRWMSLRSCRQSHIWYPHPDFSLSRKILSYKRKQFSQIVRWTTGHAFLKRQNMLVRRDLYTDSTCRICLQHPEQADHLLLDCEPLAFARAECFLSHFLPRQCPLWKPEQLLQFINTPRLRNLEYHVVG
jgi:ribonuclease HI